MALNRIRVPAAQTCLDFFRVRVWFLASSAQIWPYWDLQSQMQSLLRKPPWTLSAALLCFANDAPLRFANVDQCLSKDRRRLVLIFFLHLFFRHFWGCVWHSLQNGDVAGRNHREDEGEGERWRKQRACRVFSGRPSWNEELQHWGLWSRPFSFCVMKEHAKPRHLTKASMAAWCQTQTHSCQKSLADIENLLLDLKWTFLTWTKQVFKLQPTMDHGKI